MAQCKPQDASLLSAFQYHYPHHRTVATSVCKIHGITNCLSSYWVWAVVFAGLQLLLIQMPDLSYFCESSGPAGMGLGASAR